MITQSALTAFIRNLADRMDAGEFEEWRLRIESRGNLVTPEQFAALRVPWDGWLDVELLAFRTGEAARRELESDAR